MYKNDKMRKLIIGTMVALMAVFVPSCGSKKRTENAADSVNAVAGKFKYQSKLSGSQIWCFAGQKPPVVWQGRQSCPVGRNEHDGLAVVQGYTKESVAAMLNGGM